MIGAVGALLIFLVTSALAAIPTKYEPDLIAIDILGATDFEQNLPFDCWVGAVMSLELDKLTLPYAYNTQLSYGANFCSVLAKNQQKALAIELTKCHIKGSRRSMLPEVCFADGISNGLNKNEIKECLSALSEEGFIIYSQFFIHTEQACTKLTTELLIHRKNDAITRFEESARMIDEKMQQSILFQESIIHSMIQQNDDLSQQHEVLIHAREEMNQMMQGILSQNALIDEQKHILLSVNKVSSIQKNFASDFPFPVLTICQSFKVYDQSGFRELVEKAHEISSKRDGVFMWGRFSLIVVVSLLFLSTLKLFRLTMFICFMSILEIAAEHAIFYLHEEGSITGSQHHVYISILRKYDLPTYVSVAVLSMLASYFTNKRAQPDKVEPTIIKSELAVVLNTIEKRISVEEKARKKERKQFREQILSLQCELNSSFAVPQSSIGAPASGMKNNRSSIMVTPFLNRDLRIRATDNGSTIGITTPPTTSSPQLTAAYSKKTVIQTDNLLISDRYKRPRQDGIFQSDESTEESTTRTRKKQKSSAVVIS